MALHGYRPGRVLRPSTDLGGRDTYVPPFWPLFWPSEEWTRSFWGTFSHPPVPKRSFWVPILPVLDLFGPKYPHSDLKVIKWIPNTISLHISAGIITIFLEWLNNQTDYINLDTFEFRKWPRNGKVVRMTTGDDCSSRRAARGPDFEL